MARETDLTTLVTIILIMVYLNVECLMTLIFLLTKCVVYVKVGINHIEEVLVDMFFFIIFGKELKPN